MGSFTEPLEKAIPSMHTLLIHSLVLREYTLKICCQLKFSILYRELEINVSHTPPLFKCYTTNIVLERLVVSAGHNHIRKHLSIVLVYRRR